MRQLEAEQAHIAALAKNKADAENAKAAEARMDALQEEVKRQARESADAKAKLADLQNQKNMLPKPDPAPAQTIPPAAPYNADRQSIQAFLKDWWSHNLSNNAADWANDFATQSDYCYKETPGPARRNEVLADRAKLIARWPVRRYEAPPEDTSYRVSPDGSTATIQIKYRYHYFGGNRSAGGVSSTELDLTRSDPGWIITRFHEKVIRN